MSSSKVFSHGPPHQQGCTLINAHLVPHIPWHLWDGSPRGVRTVKAARGERGKKAMQREKVTSGVECMELTVNMKLALSQPLPQLGAPLQHLGLPSCRSSIDSRSVQALLPLSCPSIGVLGLTNSIQGHGNLCVEESRQMGRQSFRLGALGSRDIPVSRLPRS